MASLQLVGIARYSSLVAPRPAPNVSRSTVRSTAVSRITVATPLLALSEVAGAIARQTNDSKLAEKISVFLHAQPWVQFVPLTDALATEAATAAARQRLRGADAVYVALAAQRTLTLVTLDREMLERTKEIVTSVTPTAWLKQHRSSDRPAY